MSLPPFVRASIIFENYFFHFIFLFFSLSCNSSSWGPLPINKPLSYLRVEQHLVSITCPSYLCGSKQAFLPYFTPGMRRKGSQLSEMHQWGWPKNKYLKEPRRFHGFLEELNRTFISSGHFPASNLWSSVWFVRQVLGNLPAGPWTLFPLCLIAWTLGHFMTMWTAIHARTHPWYFPRTLAGNHHTSSLTERCKFVTVR
jgi:hypothetical protein